MAACLAVLTGEHTDNLIAMVDSYLTLGDAPAQVVFRTRLGLTLLDLTDKQLTSQLTPVIETDVLRSQDAYAAREVLAHPGCASQVPASTIDALTDLVDISGLGKGIMPTELLDQLTSAITAAEVALIAALAVVT